jgi:hypothetical protein
MEKTGIGDLEVQVVRSFTPFVGLTGSSNISETHRVSSSNDPQSIIRIYRDNVHAERLAPNPPGSSRSTHPQSYDPATVANLWCNRQ